MNCMEDGSLCIWYGPKVTVGQKDQLLKLKKKKEKEKQTNKHEVEESKDKPEPVRTN